MYVSWGYTLLEKREGLTLLTWSAALVVELGYVQVRFLTFLSAFCRLTIP